MHATRGRIHGHRRNDRSLAHSVARVCRTRWLALYLEGRQKLLCVTGIRGSSILGQQNRPQVARLVASIHRRIRGDIFVTAAMPRSRHDDDDDDDDRVSWDTIRGISFERCRRQARMVMSGKYLNQDDWSLWDAATGMDQNGDAQGAPLIQAGQGAQGAQNKREPGSTHDLARKSAPT